MTRACTTLSTVTAAEHKSWSKTKGQQGRSGNISDGKCIKRKGEVAILQGEVMILWWIQEVVISWILSMKLQGL